MKKIMKNLAAFAMIAAFAVSMFAIPALANDPYGLTAVDTELGDSLGGSDLDVKDTIGRFISFALGFLGLIAVGIILIGGFKWMTSGGNEEKTGEAKKLLGAGVIGLVIVLISWGLANWLIDTIVTTTNPE